MKKLLLPRHEIDQRGFEKAMENELKVICYEITIRNYFKDCYDNNVDFEKIVSDKLNMNFN